MMTPGMRTTSGPGTPANAVRRSTSASPQTNVATPVAAHVAPPQLSNGVSAAVGPAQQVAAPVAHQQASQQTTQPAPMQQFVPAVQLSVAPTQIQQPDQPVASAASTQGAAQGIPLPPPEIEKLTPVPSAANTPQQGSPVNENGKRPIEEGINDKESPEFKRINSGPAALKA